MTTNPPTGPEVIWEDFEGDFEGLKGTVTPPKKPWRRWIIAGACGLFLLGGGISGWLYFYQTNSLSENSEFASSGSVNIDKLRTLVESSNITKDGLVSIINEALALSKKFELDVKNKNNPIDSTEKDPELKQFESVLVGLQALLRLKVEFFQTMSLNDQTYFKKALNQIGIQRVTYKTNKFTEHIPLLQVAWIENRILLINKKKNPKRLLKEMKEILQVVQSEYSNTIAGAAFHLGSWFQYKNQTKLAESSFQIAQRYVEGYHAKLNYFSGIKPDSFSPFWSEYVGSLEGLASIAFNQKLYRQSRSYILRMFNTPSNTGGTTTNFDKDRLRVISNQIKNVKKDISIIKKSLQSPAQIPTHPLYTPKQDWVINWTKLSNELRKTSFYSKKNKIAQSIWKKVPPSIRSEILLQTGTKWITPENKKILFNILNTLIQNPTFKNEASNRENNFIRHKRSIITHHTAKYSQLNTEILNRRLLDQAFGSVSYIEYTLHDGTPLNQSLSPEQIRSYVHFLKKDLIQASSDSEKQKINDLIQGLPKRTSSATIIDFRNYLVFKKQVTQKRIKSKEQLYVNQNKVLKKIQKELSALELMDTIDTELILELKQNELAIKHNLLAKKFQLEKTQVEIANINKNYSSLFKSFKGLLSQREAKLANLIKTYNNAKDRSLEGSTDVIKSLDTLINSHTTLLSQLNKIKESTKKKTFASFELDLKKIDKKILNLSEKINAGQSADKPTLEKELNDAKLKQKEIIYKVNSYLSPIKTLVYSIIENEKKFWIENDSLKETRTEISSIIGSADSKGSLSEKTLERSNLLLLNSEVAIKSPEINGKISTLNDKIDKDYSRLSYLIQKEHSLRNSLATYFPQFFKMDLSNKTSIEVSHLTDSLTIQDNLLEAYEETWLRGELLSNLEVQENQILDSLKYISAHILSSSSLKENEIYDLNRSISTLISSSNMRNQIYRDLKSDSEYTSKLAISSSRGYYLDASRFFEIESKLGIDVSQYETAFSNRGLILNKILSLTVNSKNLQKQKEGALKIHDQLLIDRISPQIIQIEKFITKLSKEEIKLNQQIQKYAKSYLVKINKSRKNRELFSLTEERARNDLTNIQQNLESNDHSLYETAQKMRINLSTIDKLITDLDLKSLSNLDDFTTEVQSHLDSLVGFQLHLKKENYYKVKALWLLGLTFYQQSQLSSFLELQQSSVIPEYLVLEESKQNTIIFDEFNPSFTHAANQMQDSSKQFDESINELIHSNWILFCENSALRVFDEIIPRYLSSTSFYLQQVNSLASHEREDLYLFLSEAKLLSGNIFLKRGLKQINPHTGFRSNELLGNQFLDKSKKSFNEYINLIAPKGRVLNFSDPSSDPASSPLFPFLKNKKVIDRLSKAQVMLSECYYLQKNHQKSIETLKSFLNNILEQDPIYIQSNQASEDYIGQSFNITNEDFAFQVGLDPFYTSLLSLNPYSQDALFLLGLNYQTIAEKELNKLLHLSSSNLRYPDVQLRFQKYSRQSLAYYSQLINSQMYSPLRKVATMQRARIWSLLDDYSSARSDLISLLDVPKNSPQIANINELRFLQDIFELEYPTKSVVLMELGKLYFKNRDYEAASEAFNEAASESTASANKIFEAKASFANSLYAKKEWIKAAYLYKELLRDHADEGLGSYLSHAPDILLNYGQTLMAISNYSDASITFKKLFGFAPAEMIKNNVLNLKNPYSFEALKENYRDSIRPLMLASYYRGEIFALKKDFSQSRREFNNAKALISIVPWKQDNILRRKSKREYQSYISTWTLKSKWQLLKLKADELFFSSFSKNQKLLNQASTDVSSAHLNMLISSIRSSLGKLREDRGMFESLLTTLTNFRKTEEQLTPSYHLKKQIEKKFTYEKSDLTSLYQRFQALNSIKKATSQLENYTPTRFIAELFALFPSGSYENTVANEFSLEFAKRLHLTDSERDLMEPDLENLENFLTIPYLNKRAKDVFKIFHSWIQGEVAITGLDPSFVPVDPEISTLTEVDLYICATLNYIDTTSSYQSLKEIGLNYLKRTKSIPNRIINPKAVWSIIEVAGLAAKQNQDWEATKEFYSFLLKEGNQVFFSFPSSWDYYQAKLTYSEALLKISSQKMEQVIFMPVGKEHTDLLTSIDEERKIAYEILTKLEKLDGKDAAYNLVRIRARELLNKENI